MRGVCGMCVYRVGGMCVECGSIIMYMYCIKSLNHNQLKYETNCTEL